ncbi:hypothetical protein HRbin22_02298 [Candidatus Thermoflexus japonica]|uniref:DUF488 domain-containing protein n=1 Tax=Candidatus Thermoflexus japonica TaxID=2035417 RepID=A0A2H5Y9A5_9CHLR|nr:hypothetical protein HRbin22_02298 [Candidatus Thermoflexus japonica]
MFTIWTLGHSNRGLEEFLRLLRIYRIEQVIDVRRFPASRRHPHFCGPALAAALADVGIGYLHLPELGGRRVPRPDSPHIAWRTPGFRGYADHMESEDFRRGLERVIEEAGRSRTALMCAERFPWRCHRRLIADALTVRGVRVEHILDQDRWVLHQLPPWARLEEGRLIYAGASEPWGIQGELFSGG